jgi:flagellar assembly protein FliH
MAYKKYMFDLDFGPPTMGAKLASMAAQSRQAEAPEPEEPEAPPAPTFTEEDLQVVRESAYDEGFRAGHSDAEQATERQMAEAVVRLAQALESLHQAQERSADEAQRVAARVAMSILKKVLPATCEQNAFEEVIRTVQECFANVLDEPRIIVRVDQELLDGVRERLETEAVMHGFEGRVVVQADPRIAKGDCRVEWADGGAERDQARLIADIEAAVERSLAGPTQRPEE